MKTRKAPRGPKVAKFGAVLILTVYAAFTLFPVLMGVVNSLKTEGEILNNILALPAVPQFLNYKSAFEKIHFFRSLVNTVLVVIVGVAGIVLFSAMAGYKLSRTPGRLSYLLFGLFVMSMLVPFHSIMITLTQIARALGIQGSLVGLGLIYIGLGVPMGVFLYHGFTKSIPRDLEEAAIIDGCGEFQVFFKVIFPLLRSITATVVVINALWMWNDFLLPLLMLTDSRRYTLLLSTNMLFGRYVNEWSSILAALILALLPAVLLFLAFQKSIVRGISEGAIKG